MASKTTNQPATKKDVELLQKAMQAMLQGVIHGVVSQLRSEMHAMEDRLRHEMDSKITASERRMMEHTETVVEETVGRYNAELLENIAEIVQPMRGKLTNHERRLRKLEVARAA